MKTNKSSIQFRVPAIAISFVAGLVVASTGWFLFMGFLHSSSKPVLKRMRENKEATAFFYRTMQALFEGTYNPENGSISERALNVFNKYASNLGNKCYIKIYDNESGYHGGIVFFPSGDIFYIIIMPHSEEDFVITHINRTDWDDLWSSELKRYLPKTGAS